MFLSASGPALSHCQGFLRWLLHSSAPRALAVSVPPWEVLSPLADWDPAQILIPKGRSRVATQQQISHSFEDERFLWDRSLGTLTRPWSSAALRALLWPVSSQWARHWNTWHSPFCRWTGSVSLGPGSSGRCAHLIPEMVDISLWMVDVRSEEGQEAPRLEHTGFTLHQAHPHRPQLTQLWAHVHHRHHQLCV